MTRAVLPRLVARLTWRSSVAWIVGFAALGAATVAGYSAAYPTVAERRALASQIGANLGFQALYGRAHRLDTLGGFAAWRVGGSMMVIAAVWGALSVTKVLRGDEEAGRTELLLASPLGARQWFAVTAGVMACWQIAAGIALCATLVATGLAATGATLIATSTTVAGVSGVALGALTSQLLATRRRAAVWAGTTIGAWYLLRVLADGTSSLGVLRWVTPFGWIEEVRPFAGDRLAPLALVAALIVALVVASLVTLGSRDHGGALFADRDTGPAHSRSLRGPIRLAWRLEARTLLGWTVGMGIGSAVMGLLATDVADFARRSPGYARVARQLGIADPTAPGAFLGLAYGFLVVPFAVHVATQMANGREDEAEGRLDQLLVQPIGRARWAAGRSAVVIAGAAVIAIVMAAAAWTGVALRGGGLSLIDSMSGTLNLLPLMVLVVGVGMLMHGIAPRLTGPLTIGLVATTYALQLVGALVQAPTWVVDLSPFHHLAAVPAVGVAPLPLAVFVSLGAVTGGAGIWRFTRRDVIEA